ncbi:tetratricopeptide repeat protein [Bosea psychrotolerans]|uniref:Tetratricopeptide repeat protein n=1 Tax=Bosea psychrotolerans TaxID=1871628 RepID=A0A2S4MCC7_9HYPH|nr:tetratricopeptide repeat protein [Bosea psychrotolerans]POR52386.1 tetratricopeptide repeat protein [Bosea psychrotolerans]
MSKTDALTALVGLQRSGTNYVSNLIRERFGIDVTTRSGVWKHAFVSECADEMEGKRFLVVTRHPVMWLQSCLLHSPRDLVTRRTEFFKDGLDNPASFADVYSHYYSGWSAVCAAGHGSLVSYEATLEGGADYLGRIIGTGTTSESREHVASVPMSLAFAPEDVEAYRRLECSLDKSLVLDFWSRLDPALPTELGYDLEKISFVATKSARSLGYQFLQDPSRISEAEFRQLLLEAEGRFANDGPILDMLSIGQAQRGDQDSALLLGSRAILAYQAAMNRFAMDSGAHIPQVSAIDRLIEHLSARRAQTLQSTIDHFSARIADGGLTATQDSESCFYLSDCYYRGRDLEKAIDYGRRAIEPASDRNAGTLIVIPWLFHHLGSLLAEAGLHEEAIANFARAAELEPREYRYSMHASHSHMALGDYDGAIRTAQSALALNENLPAIRRLLAECYHQKAAVMFGAGDLAGAARYSRLSTETMPELPGYSYFLGEIEYRLGNDEAAIRAAEVATSCQPAEAWHFHFLGRMHLKVGNHAKAAQAFASARDLDPENPEHARGLEDAALLARTITETQALDRVSQA